MQNKIIQITIFVLTIFLIIPFVFADFSASSTRSNIDLCLLDGEYDNIFVKNIGGNQESYMVSLSRSAAPFVTVVPNAFVLDPGQQITLYNYLNFPSQGQNKYDLEIIITDGTITKTIDQKINKDSCFPSTSTGSESVPLPVSPSSTTSKTATQSASQSVSVNNNYLIIENFNQTTCPCSEARYDFFLKNTGNFVETYVFGVDTFAEFSSLTEPQVVLSPGESSDFSLFIEPECEIYGYHQGNFFSNAVQSGLTSTVPFVLDINKCYDFEIINGQEVPNNDAKFNASIIKTDTSYELCALDNVSIPLVIQNMVDIPNNYSYTLEGPKWGSLYGDFIRLDARESGKTYLDLSPTEVGEDRFLITMDSIVGDTTIQKVINTKVNACYGLIVDVPERETLCGCPDQDIEFTLWNTGLFSEKVELEIEGDDFLYFGENNITLEAGEEKKLSLKSNYDCNAKLNNVVKVKTRSDKAYSEDILNLQVLPIQECYFLTYDTANTKYIDYETNSIRVNLMHTGAKASKYAVKIEGEDWISSSVNDFTLSPGERFSFDLLSNPPRGINESDFFVNINIDSDEVIYQKTVKLKLRENKPFWTNIGFYVNFYRYWIVTVLALLIIIVALFFYLKEKSRVWKIKQMIKEATKNGNGNNKHSWIFYVFSSIIGLILLIYILGFFSQNFKQIAITIWSFFLSYIWYFVLGFILLIIIIQIMNRMEKK